MKQNLIILLISVSFFLMCSCKKETPTSPIPFKIEYVANELKAWGLFKPGSYWIYQDTITGYIDSVYVTSVKQYIQNSLSSDLQSEMIKVNFQSGYGFSSYTLDHLGYIKGDNGVLVFYLEEGIPASSGIFENRNIPSYTVLGTLFNDVRYVAFYEWHTAQSSGYSASERNYLKKNIGIIKREARLTYLGGHNQTLELIKYHVIQ